MKKCPQCRAVYADEMIFCLQDGSALLLADEEPTIVLRQPVAAPPQVIKQGVSPIFAYLTIGLLALLISGGVAAFIFLKPPVADPSKTDAVRNSPPPTATPLQATPPLAPLTAETVQNLMNAWEKAQDARNFALYKSCYDPSFKGTKRTASGSVSRYNYAQWLDDRQKMMSKAKYMDVRIDKMRISIQNDVATVEFDQYFTTTGYADFGPKVIEIKMTEKGAKIVYEELKSSTILTD